MPEPIIMPKAGMAMEEGQIVRWLKQEGDAVDKGEPVVEIETDKVTMEVEADCAGTLLKIVRGDGDTVPVIETIAWIGSPGDPIPEPQAGGEAPAHPPEHAAGEAARAAQLAVASASTAADGEPRFGKVAATPAARRIAHQRGVDLATVRHSGRHGEVRVADVSQAPQPVAAVALPAAPEDRRERLTGIRKRIADRISLSCRTIPAATLYAKAEVSEMCGLRKRLNQVHETRFTFNDFVLKAVAIALREHPELNAHLTDDEVIYRGSINLGIAVDAGNGLVVPVIADADRLALRALSQTARELVERARAATLAPDDLAGATFTITNLGMFDICGFTPIINPPEVAILGVCAIEDVVQMVDGEPATRKIMGLCLTHDHRLVDGALAARFLGTLRQLLEKPLRLLVH